MANDQVALPDADVIAEANKKIDDFGSLLDEIKELDRKDKKLYKEIYENAVFDRQNAYGLFIALINITKLNSTEHSVHGRTLVQYIERMSRANEQLLKLADLISRSKQEDEKINTDAIFDTLQSQGRSKK